MGRITLQMMVSLDGMLSGPKGELDWIAQDEPLNQDHLARLRRAEAVIMGVGASSMSRYWTAAEHDDKANEVIRALGHAINQVPKIIYSHKTRAVDWRNSRVHVVADDRALAEDIARLKRDTQRDIVCYGGVRFARTLLQKHLLDELHLDVCPVILGAGEPLFSGLTDRTNLRLHESVNYDSGAVLMHYVVAK
jgi:dihydrofolate reductase